MGNRSSFLGLKTIGILSLFAGSIAMGQSVSLRPSLEEDMIDTKIGGSSVLSLGFYADSSVPLGNPFTLSNSTADGRFAYGAPVGLGIDLGIGLSPRWELGLSVGYQKFEAREIGGAGADENFLIGKYTGVPVRALLRYRFPEVVVAPEIEIAAGASFQTTSVRSSVLSTEETTRSSIAPYGHIGAGIAYAWGDDLTIHFVGGYSALMSGKKTFQDGANYTVATNSLVHGFFSKGMVRVQF